MTLYTKKVLLAIVLLSAAMISATFAQDSQSRDLEPFTRLSVSNGIRLHLIPGSDHSARIEASEIDVREVITEVRGGRLTAKLDNGRRWRNPKVEIWLNYSSLVEIEVSSAARVTSDSPVKSEMLTIEASSSGNCDLEVISSELRVQVSSSGEVVLTGNATRQRVEASSAGSYDGLELASKEVQASVSSAGKISVNAEEKLDASASSAGRIRYTGNPAKVHSNSSSGGSVRKSS